MGLLIIDSTIYEAHKTAFFSSKNLSNNQLFFSFWDEKYTIFYTP